MSSFTKVSHHIILNEDQKNISGVGGDHLSLI